MARKRDFARLAPSACRRDLLVGDSCAVREHRRPTVLDDVERESGTGERFARSPGQRAEGVIHIGDAAVAVAPHDHVALRFEEAARALLGLLEFPVAVGEPFEPLLEPPLIGAQILDPTHDQHEGAERRHGQPAADAERQQWLVEGAVVGAALRSQHQRQQQGQDQDYDARDQRGRAVSV